MKNKINKKIKISSIFMLTASILQASIVDMQNSFCLLGVKQCEDYYQNKDSEEYKDCIQKAKSHRSCHFSLSYAHVLISVKRFPQLVYESMKALTNSLWQPLYQQFNSIDGQYYINDNGELVREIDPIEFFKICDTLKIPLDVSLKIYSEFMVIVSQVPGLKVMEDKFLQICLDIFTDENEKANNTNFQ